MSRYVDSHCHLDRFDDPPSVLAAATRVGVVTVAVTELPSRFQLLATQLRVGSAVRVAIGFHPLSSAPDIAHELALFARLVDRTDYVGEVGLDHSDRGRVSARRQREIFERVLAHPRITHKVLTVHSQRAEKETIGLLRQSQARAILHWYSGPLGLIEDALASGLYFSANPAMVRSRNGRRILEALPRERVITETDAPYTRIGSRPAEPRDVPSVAAELARVWGLTADEARDAIFANMAALHAAATSTADDAFDRSRGTPATIES